MTVNENEMRARLVVLEVLSMTTLGIIFTLTASSDPHHQKAIATLDAIKTATKRRLSGTTGEAETLQAGETYLDELLSDLSENLGLMRPKGKSL
jgi:hypothetical protein